MSAVGELVSVPFHGDTLLAMEDDDGRILFAVKPIVDALGLSWARQYRSIKEDDDLGPTIAVRATVGADGRTREMVCLPIEMLSGWLFKIKASRASDATRERLKLYRRECYAVLDRHFRPKRSTGSPAAAAARARRMEASLHHTQMLMLNLIKAYGALGLGEVYQRMALGVEACNRTLELFVDMGAVELGWHNRVRTARYIEPEDRSAAPDRPRDPPITPTRFLTFVPRH